MGRWSQRWRSSRRLSPDRFGRVKQEWVGPPPTLAWDIAVGLPREPINGPPGVM
jgi:hypothetical protein